MQRPQIQPSLSDMIDPWGRAPAYPGRPWRDPWEGLATYDRPNDPPWGRAPRPDVQADVRAARIPAELLPGGLLTSGFGAGATSQAAPPTAPADLDDKTWLALAIYDEARGESPDGRAAVGQAVLNRMRLMHMSDGSMRGTVMKPQQFSGFWFRSLDGREGSVDPQEADRRAMEKLAEARRSRVWPEIADTADRLMAGKYKGGPEFMKLKDAVNFYAPQGVGRPDWATPDRFVTRIGGHDFYTR